MPKRSPGYIDPVAAPSQANQGSFPGLTVSQAQNPCTPRPHVLKTFSRIELDALSTSGVPPYQKTMSPRSATCRTSSGYHRRNPPHTQKSAVPRRQSNSFFICQEASIRYRHCTGLSCETV